jgi:hypothetical protein
VTEYITFDARIEALVWGRATYTILRVPPDVVVALGQTKRVAGEINDHPVNLALTRAPVCTDVFLWAGQSLLDRIGVQPGAVLEVRLRASPDDLVDTPEDVALALRAADVASAWESLTPGKQRGLLHGICTAKTTPTRAKRIAALVASLTGPLL